MRQSGWTLIELMWWGVLTTILCATMLSISAQIRQTERVASEYVSDLTECRRAIRTLEWDVRCATRVETTNTSVRIHRGTDFVDYTLVNGVLTRSEARTARVVARRIRTFTARQDGRTVELRITLLPRRKDPSVQEASIHSTIFLRNGNQARNGGRP